MSHAGTGPAQLPAASADCSGAPVEGDFNTSSSIRSSGSAALPGSAAPAQLRSPAAGQAGFSAAQAADSAEHNRQQEQACASSCRDAWSTHFSYSSFPEHQTSAACRSSSTRAGQAGCHQTAGTHPTRCSSLQRHSRGVWGIQLQRASCGQLQRPAARVRSIQLRSRGSRSAEHWHRGLRSVQLQSRGCSRRQPASQECSPCVP